MALVPVDDVAALPDEDLAPQLAQGLLNFLLAKPNKEELWYYVHCLDQAVKRKQPIRSYDGVVISRESLELIVDVARQHLSFPMRPNPSLLVDDDVNQVLLPIGDGPGPASSSNEASLQCVPSRL